MYGAGRQEALSAGAAGPTSPLFHTKEEGGTKEELTARDAVCFPARCRWTSDILFAAGRGGIGCRFVAVRLQSLNRKGKRLSPRLAPAAQTAGGFGTDAADAVGMAALLRTAAPELLRVRQEAMAAGRNPGALEAHLPGAGSSSSQRRKQGLPQHRDAQFTESSFRFLPSPPFRGCRVCFPLCCLCSLPLERETLTSYNKAAVLLSRLFTPSLPEWQGRRASEGAREGGSGGGGEEEEEEEEGGPGEMSHPPPLLSPQNAPHIALGPHLRPPFLGMPWALCQTPAYGFPPPAQAEMFARQQEILRKQNLARYLHTPGLWASLGALHLTASTKRSPLPTCAISAAFPVSASGD
ncbi:hypothetical protein P4O66_004592 [Electrophorus voltai]|uniref:Uncharacterized protein n=1 Tax=Electrophorus voltai TaxID=2609070 RepID=A0AAD8ZNV6_9TELE|nr:hypothetical protein P4O66_004592 [Electrophorus voltai]